jgi:hypothetical protein
MAPTLNHRLRSGLAAAAVLAVGWAHSATALSAASAAGLEYEVKAAMIYNFTRFVEWPAAAWKDARAPLVVGVFGSDPFSGVLDETLREKSYGGRRIEVRRVQTAIEAEACQVLFIPKSEKKKVAELLASLRASSILTISDSDDFTRAGGVIGFVTVDNRVRFAINKASAEKAGLTVSSKLLRLSATEN